MAMRKVGALWVFAGLLLAGCITEGAPESTRSETEKSPVERVEVGVKERVERMKFQFGSELLATMHAIIAHKELARGPVTDALPTSDPRTRANLIYILGYLGGSESHKVLQPYLADRDPVVRYEAASAVFHLGDWSAVPTLMEFMDSDDRRLRYKAFETLKERVREDFGYDFNAAAPERAAALGRWQSWWNGRRQEIIYGRN